MDVIFCKILYRIFIYLSLEITAYDEVDGVTSFCIIRKFSGHMFLTVYRSSQYA